jgi:3D (Asp-Asp-Asp) domain-containing protein
MKYILLGLLGLALLASTTMAAEKETTYTVTAYCTCKICCGKWYIPGGKQKTASGAIPIEGDTIAAPRRYPFGTKLDVEGVGVLTVRDRLARRFDQNDDNERFDVYMSSHARAKEFGKRRLKIKKVS